MQQENCPPAAFLEPCLLNVALLLHGAPGRARTMLRRAQGAPQRGPAPSGISPESQESLSPAPLRSQVSSAFERRAILLSLVNLARPAGVEPATYGFEGRRSIQLSYGRRSIELIAYS